ncbi:hypothetical protein OKW24_000992 [Peribacillus simplex]|nr:hypothetical protein [Peribacillus simplex]
MQTEYDGLPLKTDLEDLVGVNSSTYTNRSFCPSLTWNCDCTLGRWSELVTIRGHDDCKYPDSSRN